MRPPLASREQVEEYLAGETIACLFCGREFRLLTGKHLRTHGIDPASYRERFGLPAGTPLAGTAVRSARAEIAHRLIQSGQLRPDPAAASEAARNAGRGTRVPWERQEQAMRAAKISHDQLEPGARRADGRDADNARAYQRQYRKARNDSR